MIPFKKTPKPEDEYEDGIFFFQGNRRIEIKKLTEVKETTKPIAEVKETTKPIAEVKERIDKLITTKNIHFLLGAGTSTKAIPLMTGMQEEIERELENKPELKKLYDLVKEYLVEKDSEKKDSEKKDSEKKDLSNLENILNKLYSAQNIPELLSNDGKSVGELIKEIKKYILKKVRPDKSCKGYEETLGLYKKFYQKIVNRNEDLARVNVFTTNYDLFSEKALDNLNINYNNGFSGGLERSFNPAYFRHTLSKKIDIELKKFKAIENMIYLYKLHGSVNWVAEDDNSLFEIQEVALNGLKSNDDEDKYRRVLIYPTPHKQGQSLGRPYSDLLREFQNKLTLPHSVLFVIGYSFSDEHIDDIIYQSLTANSSLSIFIFGCQKDCKLNKIDDTRIYRLYSKGKSLEPVHHFKYIVNNILPRVNEDKDEDILRIFKEKLLEKNGNSIIQNKQNKA